MNLLTADDRRHAYRYWIRDPLVGARLLLAHELLRLLPTGAVSRIGADLAEWVGPRLHPAAERRARAALQVLRPDLVAGEPQTAEAMSRLWRSLGRAYAEFSAEDRLWAEGRVTVAGEEHLRAVRESGRPLLVAGVHLANWELIPITLGYLGHRVIDVYQPQRNRFEDRIAMRARLRIAGRVLRSVPSMRGLSLEGIFRLVPPTPRAGAELLQGLSEGRALMMFVDENANGRVHAPRFGRPVPADGNMARVVRLARMVSGSVVPAYVERVAESARFTVHFLPPLRLERSADSKADLAANVARLDAALAPHVLDAVEQWYMLTDYRHDR